MKSQLTDVPPQNSEQVLANMKLFKRKNKAKQTLLTINDNIPTRTSLISLSDHMLPLTHTPVGQPNNQQPYQNRRDIEPDQYLTYRKATY